MATPICFVYIHCDAEAMTGSLRFQYDIRIHGERGALADG